VTTRWVVLVGLPGAGKSTVGPLVAARLGWPFVDLDTAIEREAGMRIREIFAREGEVGFRRREHAATLALAAEGVGAGERGTGGAGAAGGTDPGSKAPGPEGVVLAPGGGWMLDPANRAALGGQLVTVYLRVAPEVAARRLAASGSADRPLLAGGDAVRGLTELLARREPTYLQANHTLRADSLAPEEVATLIVALASPNRAD
jgi:shikimate kinase